MSKACSLGVGSGTRTFPIVVGDRRLNDTADALKALSEPWSAGERTKVAIGRAARLAGLSYWRAFDIWYRKARKVEPYEVDAIVDRLISNEAKETRNELSELRLRLARLESRLVQTDAEFHREDIAQLGQQLRGSR